MASSRVLRLAPRLRSPTSLIGRHPLRSQPIYSLSKAPRSLASNSHLRPARAHRRRYATAQSQEQNEAPLERPQDAPCFCSDLNAFAQNTLNLLYPSSETPQPHTLPAPGPRTASYVRNVVFGGSELANKRSRASFVAGGDAEGDEFGDVGFWLAKDAVKEGEDGLDVREVLRTLGLHHLAEEDRKVAQYSLDSGDDDALPSHMAELLKNPPEGLEELAKMTGRSLVALKDKQAFSADLEGSKRLYVFLGRLTLPSDDEDGWVGVMGIGIDSDSDSGFSWKRTLMEGALFAFLIDMF